MWIDLPLSFPQDVGPVEDEIGDLGSEPDIGQKVSCQGGVDASVVFAQFVVDEVLGTKIILVFYSL